VGRVMSASSRMIFQFTWASSQDTAHQLHYSHRKFLARDTQLYRQFSPVLLFTDNSAINILTDSSATYNKNTDSSVKDIHKDSSAMGSYTDIQLRIVIKAV
jgi:hypothetical protein